MFSVAVRPGEGSIVNPASYVISYRLTGVGVYTERTILAADGALNISGFAVGDVIDVKARAISSYGQTSADSAVAQATLHPAETSTPTADSTLITADSSLYKADYF